MSADESHDGSWMVLVLFFGSGATALVYEVVWSKFLSQMFGSTIYAQTVVLAAFMGGLALGNKLLADGPTGCDRRCGLMAFWKSSSAFTRFVSHADRVADNFRHPGHDHRGATRLLLLVKGVLSAGLLLGPTILMGGTLPLLAAWLQQFSSDAGRRSARFYSVNSLGAVTGATLAGFWLVQNFGLIATLQITGLVNVFIGMTAGWLSRNQIFEMPAATESRVENSTRESSSLSWRLSGVIVALTGAVSMALEVLASRSLALIFGSSLQSFAVVLMAFILGIGLGSAWMASARRKISDRKLVVLLLCVAAAWMTLLVFNIERWVDFYRIVGTGIARTTVGYFYYQVMTTGIALVVLGVPAACLGAVLPLMIRAATGTDAHLGARVGALLTWNTLGAVVGTLIAGFVLMPLIGLRNAFGALALVLALSALLIALRSGWRVGSGLASLAGVFVISLFLFGGEDWRWVMTSGVFRGREKEFNPTAMPMRKLHTKLLFYEDAADATVTVEQGDYVPGVASSADRSMRVNGKPDATAHADFNTQMLIAHLPLLTHPDSKDVFIFGLGSGISVGAIQSYPSVKKIVIAETASP